jgi:hypothetical protein
MKVRGGTISKKKQDLSGPDDSTLEELRVTRWTYEWSEKQTRTEEQISGFRLKCQSAQRNVWIIFNSFADIFYNVLSNWWPT